MRHSIRIQALTRLRGQGSKRREGYGFVIHRQPLDLQFRTYGVKCRASTTLSGSDNHFGRFMSRCDVAYFVVFCAAAPSILVTDDVVAGALW